MLVVCGNPDRYQKGLAKIMMRSVTCLGTFIAESLSMLTGIDQLPPRIAMSSSSSRSSFRSRPLGTHFPSNSLDAILPYLLASKRSLATIDQVYRANEICTSTRDALEKSAISSARTSFVRSGIASQLQVLQQVQQQTNKSAQLVITEFEDVIKRLNDAEKRLRDTLNSLRDTIVEAQLRPEGEEKRCLLDFVDESGVEGLVANIKELVEGMGNEVEQFAVMNKEFEGEAKSVGDMISAKGKVSDSCSMDTSREERNPIPEILGDMEEHAKDTAVNLESLVSHFDLCVTAVKHTEGGGDAALKIAGDLPRGLSLGQDAPPEPISDEQKSEMMRVLEEDAGQVEDVVMEIKSRIVDMDTMYQRVETYMNLLSSEHGSTVAAFKLLEGLGQKLSSHITRNHSFFARWDEARVKMEEQLDELHNAKNFYDGFLRAYDNLIVEIGRRKSNEVKIDKIVKDTRLSLEKLYEDDLFERETFKREQGEFLPVDIWPGLLNAPTRFNIGPVDGLAERSPDISKSVIHKAIRRVHGPV